jgi:hypothetical protein
MARTMAELPKGTRITDFISLGVLTRTVPVSQVKAVLAAQGRASQRQRELPAHVVVYYVICLALFMQVSYREVLRCLLEGLAWLLGPGATVKVTGKSGISQARTRLGWEVMRQLHEEVVKPLAAPTTPGAWYRRWRLVSLDGSTLEVADEKENEQAFARPSASRGHSAYPQIRFVSLVENGTHVLFGTRLANYATGEITLAQEVLGCLQKGMLCLADRNFFGFALWNRARATGADLLWRVKKNLRLRQAESLSARWGRGLSQSTSRPCRPRASSRHSAQWVPIQDFVVSSLGSCPPGWHRRPARPGHRRAAALREPARVGVRFFPPR